MRRITPIAAVLALATPAGATPADIASHIEAGKSASAPDFPGLAPLCNIAPRASLTSRRPTGSGPLPAMPLGTRLPPRQVFDNLYFVGTTAVSAWIIRTEAGLILVDALNNADEAKDVIVAGMQNLGLDPADIKYLIITHGHGDHYGGSTYLVDHFKPRVIMSAADWSLVEDNTRRLDLSNWGPPPKRDMVAASPSETLTLGGTSITIVSTPGHTEGTISLIFPVSLAGKTHQAVLWGGTGFNFGALVDRYEAYARSAQLMQREVLTRKIDVFLSNHPARDETLTKFAAMDAGAGDNNPFILSTPRVARAFDVFRECATANALAAAAE